MATVTQAAQFRAANDTLLAALERDLQQLWSTMPLDRPERTRDLLLEYLPQLVHAYGDMATTLAAEWFEELREQAMRQGLIRAAGTLATYRAVTVSPAQAAPTVALESQVRFGAQHLFTATPEQTLAFLKQDAGKRVVEMSGNTVATNASRDRAARGWQRLTRPGACKFCRMLSSRGGVYTDRTALFNAHNGSCRCVAAPTWDPDAPPVDVRAQFVASARTSRMDPQQREEFRARVAGYLDAMPDDAGTTYVGDDD